MYLPPTDTYIIFMNVYVLLNAIIHLSFQESGWLSWYNDGLRAGRPEFESRQGQDFSPVHSVQTGPGAHPASYPMGTGGDLPGGNAAGA
jgi:hypothetical protein